MVHPVEQKTLGLFGLRCTSENEVRDRAAHPPRGPCRGGIRAPCNRVIELALEPPLLSVLVRREGMRLTDGTGSDGCCGHGPVGEGLATREESRYRRHGHEHREWEAQYCAGQNDVPYSHLQPRSIVMAVVRPQMWPLTTYRYVATLPSN